MSIITDFLNLFKYDPETDGDNTFNIKQCLNDNWDKIDAWASGIKTTIAGLVPGTRKVNGKELSADVTLTGEDIKTSASDETTISSQLSNTALTSYGVLQAQNVLDWAKAQTRNGAFSVAPGCTGVPDTAAWYAGSLLVNVPGSAWTLYLFNTTTREAICNFTVSGEWNGWISIATATTPQIFDVPLAAGWTKHRASEYFKTQENIVTVYFQVHTSSPQGGEVILARLPEGFRPPNTIGGSGCCGITGEKYAPADVKVYPNGDITGFNDVGAAEYYTGFFTFIAAPRKIYLS